MQPRAPSAAVPCSKDVGGRITLGIPCARGDDAGVRLGPAPGRCALGAARAERALPQAVAPSSLGDCPGCWPSAGPGRGGRTCQLTRQPPRAGARTAPLAPRASGEQGSGFLICSACGDSELACGPRARRGNGRAALVFQPLFSGWKGNEGRGQPFPTQSPLPCFLPPAGQPGVGFRPRSHSLAAAFSWLCSWAVAALLLNLLSEAPHPLIAQKGVVALLFLFFCPTLWHIVS